MATDPVVIPIVADISGVQRPLNDLLSDAKRISAEIASIATAGGNVPAALQTQAIASARALGAARVGLPSGPSPARESIRAELGALRAAASRTGIGREAITQAAEEGERLQRQHNAETRRVAAATRKQTTAKEAQATETERETADSKSLARGEAAARKQAIERLARYSAQLGESLGPEELEGLSTRQLQERSAELQARSRQQTRDFAAAEAARIRSERVTEFEADPGAARRALLNEIEDLTREVKINLEEEILTSEAINRARLEVLLEDQELAAAAGRAKATRQAEQGLIQQATAQAFIDDPSLREAVVGGRVATERERSRQDYFYRQALLDEEYLGLQAANLVDEQRQRLAIQSEIALDRDLIRTKAESLVIERQGVALLAEEVRNQAQQTGLSEAETALILRRIGVQQVALPTGGGGGGGATRAAGAGAGGFGFFGGGLRSVIRYGLPGTLFYGALTGVRSVIEEATQLDLILSRIRQQFIALDREGDFEQFRSGILDISRDLGESATEVANVAFQLEGAFGGNTVRAIEETRSAIAAVKTTGLELREVIDAFTALTQNFVDAGVTIEDVSDSALGLQSRFGVLARETISFAADLAPVAAQAGFTVEQLEALGAVAQKYSGRTGAGLAEAFGRIIPQIQGNALPIIQFFRAELEQLAPAVVEAFRTSDIQAFVSILAGSFDQLSTAQQNYIIDLLGGRREAQALIPVLRNGSELLNEFSNAGQDAGQTQAFLATQQETLSFQIQKLGVALQQLGIEIFEGGLKDFLLDLVQFGTGAVGILEAIANALQTIGSVLNTISFGQLDKLLQALVIVGAARGVGSLVGSFTGGAGIGGLFNRSAAANAARAVSGGFSFPTAAGTTITAPGQGAAAGLAAGIRTGFAGFPWATVGLTVGAIALAGIQQGVEEAGAEARAEVQTRIAGAANRETAIARILRSATGVDTSGGLDDIEETIRELQSRSLVVSPEIESLADLRETAASAAAEHNSWVQQRLAEIDASEAVKADQERAREAIGALFQPLREQLEGWAAQPDLISAAAEAIFEEEGRGLVTVGRTTRVARSAEHVVDAIEDEVNALLTGFDEAINPVEIIERTQALVNIFRAGSARQAAQLRDAIRDQVSVLSGEEALRLLESGDIGYSAAIDALSSEASILRSLPETEENLIELAETEQKIRELLRDRALGVVEGILRLESLGGEPDPLRVVGLYTDALRSGNLTPEAETEASEAIVEALGQLHQIQIDATDSLSEQARLLAAGFELPPEIRVQALSNYMQTASEAVQTFLNALSADQDRRDALADRLAALVIETGASLEEAARIVVNRERQRLVVLIRMLRANEATSAEINAAVEQLKGLEDLFNELVNAEVVLPTVPTTGGADPAAAAERQRQAAEEARQNARDLAEARLNFALAFVENDPIEAARIAQQRADVAYQFAESEADQINAQADRIRADRQLQDAINDIFNSRTELAIALAEAAGDEVLAAELGLRLVRDQIDQATARGAGEAELNALRAQEVAAVSNLGDARLSNMREEIEFNLEMGNITRDQAIAQLRGLLALADTEEETRDLLRRIRALTEEGANQDLQFNLPTQLGLPTPYEVRRLQGGGGNFINGGGYSDNRVITVNVTAKTDASPDLIAKTVVGVIGDPKRFGSFGKRY